MKYYAQFGEDEALASIFDSTRKGTCVEVGAYNGADLSNTYHFERLGWRCVLIEPNPQLCELIRKNRQALLFECAASDFDGDAAFFLADNAARSSLEKDPNHSEHLREKVGEIREARVPTRRLDAILEEAGVNALDFISIDVEGHELSVLRGFTVDRWRPRIVILEDNSEFRDPTSARYLERFGYRRFKRTGCNDWYARIDDRELHSWSNRAVLGYHMVVMGILNQLPVPFVAWLRRTRAWLVSSIGGAI